MLLVENYDDEKPNLKDYFKNLHISDKKASGFESFVRCWVILERAVREFYSQSDIKSNKYLIPDFKILLDKRIISLNESNNLKSLRKVRNYLLHGIETPSEDYLKDSFLILKNITTKVVDKIPVKDLKDSLKKLEKIK